MSVVLSIKCSLRGKGSSVSQHQSSAHESQFASAKAKPCSALIFHYFSQDFCPSCRATWSATTRVHSISLIHNQEDEDGVSSEEDSHNSPLYLTQIGHGANIRLHLKL